MIADLKPTIREIRTVISYSWKEVVFTPVGNVDPYPLDAFNGLSGSLFPCYIKLSNSWRSPVTGMRDMYVKTYGNGCDVLEHKRFPKKGS